MSKVIDLSLPFEHGSSISRGTRRISVLVHNTVSTIGYNITQFSMSTHQGTHLDAPYHFFDDGRTVDQIPLDCCYGPALLMDLASARIWPPRPQSLSRCSNLTADQIQPGAKVIYRTGWDRAFGTPEYFSDFPSLTLEAAQWLPPAE